MTKRRKRGKRDRLPPEVRELFEHARRNAAGSPPRKHHLVPASYLRRWAEEGQVRVTVVDEHRSYLSSPATAARETDFYRLDHPDLDPGRVPPLLFETLLSKIEDKAKTAVDELLRARDVTAMDPELVAWLAVHLAFTFTRGRTFRAQHQGMLNDAYRMQYAGVTDEAIRARLVERGVEPTPAEVAKSRAFLDELQTGEVWVADPDAKVVASSGQAAEVIGEALLQRRWAVYETPPILVTSDEPVVTLGGPGAPRGEAAGVETAGALLFPLSPSALLVLFHSDMRPMGPRVLDRVETAEVNREILAGSARWAFERPSRHVAKGLRVPPVPDVPFIREGPLPQVGDAESELFRWFVPTRWRDETSAPPWPVRRWWSGWSAEQFPTLDSLLRGGGAVARREQGR